MNKTPRHMPTMNAVIAYWREHEQPWLKSWYIGWGEPFCFGCGWLPPVQDGRSDSWRQANKWLDRAHLQDRCVGGPDEPFNLVPLCHLCHDAMPDSDTYDKGLAWVKNRQASTAPWQVWTDGTLRKHSSVARSTLIHARQKFLEVS